jgi:HSP20 family protein
LAWPRDGIVVGRGRARLEWRLARIRDFGNKVCNPSERLNGLAMADKLTSSLRSWMTPTAEECRRVDWCPAADIYATSCGWLVKLDLAGVRPQDIELIVRGRRLTVRGVRRDCTLEEGQRHYSLEISYNRFERTLDLPGNVEAARISTDYRDGMLLVHLSVENVEA